MRNHHFLLVCFPVQGHINPSLELAHRLINLGHHVTFATTIVASRRMINNRNNITTSTTQGLLSFATFSDGFDEEGLKTNRRLSFSELKRCGSQSLRNLIISNNDYQSHRPFTFVIYTLLFNWAGDVASAFGIPSALVFVQPATLLALYYYYFHGYGDSICNQLALQDSSLYIELPGLPSLTSKDMPSFFSPSSPHAHIVPLFKEQVEFLDQQTQSSKVLVNTFDALEIQALKAIDGLKMLPIGPLIPSYILDGGLSQIPSENCTIEWLNSKAKSSVVYISFGSVCVLGSKQEEEIVHALLESGYTFLWVMIGEKQEKDEERLKKLVVEEQGKIVAWCCQIEVLNHPSLGCFMTHCGWNSTIESLASGLPMVAFPLQIDQTTNAKLVEDLWKTGVRVKANSQGIVEREEIKQCLDLVMGSTDKAQRKEMVENSKKCKQLATQAIAEGGTSYLNLKAFVDEIGQKSCSF